LIVKVQAIISERNRRWRKGQRRYSDHIDIANSFLYRIGSKSGDPIHRYVEMIIDQPTLQRGQQINRLKAFRRLGRQADFDAVILPVTWAALRPLLKKPIYDEIFEDALQSSSLAMIEYLKTMDLQPDRNWTTLGSFIPMNARIDEIIRIACVVSPGKFRSMKKVTAAIERCGALFSSLNSQPVIDHLKSDLAQEYHSEIDELTALFPGDDPHGLEETDHTGSMQNIDTSLDLRNLIRWAARHLDERDLGILRYRYLDPDEKSYEEIGEIFRLSAERIRQLEKALTVKLRQAWETDLHHDFIPAREPKKIRNRQTPPRNSEETGRITELPDSIIVQKKEKQEMPANDYQDIPVEVLSQIRETLSKWVAECLTSDEIVDLILPDAPAWIRNLLGDGIAAEIRKTIEDRFGKMPMAAKASEASCRIDDTDWPVGATHRLKSSRYTGYGTYEAQTGRMVLLAGSTMRKGDPDTSASKGYLQAYKAVRMARGLTEEHGDLVVLLRDVAVAGPSVGVAVIGGYGGTAALWQDRDNQDLKPYAIRATRFASGLLVDLSISPKAIDARKPGSDSTMVQRMIRKVAYDIAETAQGSVHLDADVPFQNAFPKTAGAGSAYRQENRMGSISLFNDKR